MATPTRDTETEEKGYDPEPLLHEYNEARVRALLVRVDSQERELARLKLLLVIVVYVFVFGYFVGRDNASSLRP